MSGQANRAPHNHQSKLCAATRSFQGGKVALFGFFVGQVMKAMAGKANPGVVNERLRAKLD